MVLDENDTNNSIRDRERSAQTRASSRFYRVAAILGLVGAYGMFASILARFLYPARPTEKRWLLVAPLSGFQPGESRSFRAPNGEGINVTRQGQTGAAEDFVALSSVCPHLGCQVHWEAHNDRFFCPCHNGVFSPDGRAVSGPPADASQSLIEYPLRVDRGLLFVEVRLDSLAQSTPQLTPGQNLAPPGPGHDPCLYRRRSAARNA